MSRVSKDVSIGLRRRRMAHAADKATTPMELNDLAHEGRAKVNTQPGANQPCTPGTDFDTGHRRRSQDWRGGEPQGTFQRDSARHKNRDGIRLAAQQRAAVGGLRLAPGSGMESSELRLRQGNGRGEVSSGGDLLSASRTGWEKMRAPSELIQHESNYTEGLVHYNSLRCKYFRVSAGI